MAERELGRNVEFGVLRQESGEGGGCLYKRWGEGGKKQETSSSKKQAQKRNEEERVTTERGGGGGEV